MRRKRLKNMSTKEKKKYVKKHRQPNRIYVKLKCSRCQRQYRIQTSKKHAHLYNAKLKKNYVCLICKI